jgi:small subunit ribosomal protein S2
VEEPQAEVAPNAEAATAPEAAAPETEVVDLEAVLGGGIRKAPAAITALADEAEAAESGL